MNELTIEQRGIILINTYQVDKRFTMADLSDELGCYLKSTQQLLSRLRKESYLSADKSSNEFIYNRVKDIPVPETKLRGRRVGFKMPKNDSYHTLWAVPS